MVVHSHNYDLFERLQRSFDEAYAFRSLFGYAVPKPMDLGALVARAYPSRSSLCPPQRAVWSTDHDCTLGAALTILCA